ncbi:hypothetical protein H4R99_007517 [Coemansia sp. RSA 1722]|nr:hypothetical protein H4R99_007517 [Coemansia sp. RSA 1722]KAJ2599591.1 hypothetical protein GGF39_002163 [Coemansia sp. RSA 1721]
MPLATGESRLHLRPGTLRDTRSFAQLSQLLHTFYAALQLEALDLDQLEHELGDSPQRPLVRHILKRALRILTGNSSITEDKLDTYVPRVWEKYAGEAPQGFAEQGLDGLGSGDRLGVVLQSCELMFCRPENVRGVGSTDALEPRELRTEPIGQDDLHRRYWLVGDRRLYRETSKPVADLLLGQPESNDTDEGPRRSTRAAAQKTKTAVPVRFASKDALELCDMPRHRMREADGDLWELLCETSGDWSQMKRVFCRSKSSRERRLYKAISDVSVSAIQRLNKISKSRQTQEALAVRKRSTRIAMRQSLVESEAVSSLDEEPRPKRTRGSEPATKESREQRAKRRELARLSTLDFEDAQLAIQRIAESEPASADRDEPMHAWAGQQQQLVKEEQEEADDWMFRCSCGKAGHNYDDGRAMTACEQCGIWRHLGCALRAEARRTGREIDEDDWETIRYVCPDCRTPAQA